MEGQTKMKAIVLEAFGKPVVVKEVDIPHPEEGQVLIRVEAAPINPSDAMFLKGAYQNPRPVPCVPGFEGSGLVVKSGGGAHADSLVNKRVSFTCTGDIGSYAQYTVTSARQVFAITDDLTYSETASSFVNPVTVVAMLQVTQEAGVKAVVHSAAASALGRMMVRYFKSNGVKVINIVRRQEQVDILVAEGADLIVNSSEAGYLEKVKALAKEHNATIFFDPIAGAQTGEVLTQLPNNSVAYVYGALSAEASSISPTELLFKGKELKGFWLSKWLQVTKPEVSIPLLGKVAGLLKTELKTEIGKEVPLEEGQDAVEYYLKNMSSGKILFKPFLEK